jgi:hypothetical protein
MLGSICTTFRRAIYGDALEYSITYSNANGFHQIPLKEGIVKLLIREWWMIDSTWYPSLTKNINYEVDALSGTGSGLSDPWICLFSSCQYKEKQWRLGSRSCNLPEKISRKFTNKLWQLTTYCTISRYG